MNLTRILSTLLLFTVSFSNAQASPFSYDFRASTRAFSTTVNGIKFSAKVDQPAQTVTFASVVGPIQIKEASDQHTFSCWISSLLGSPCDNKEHSKPKMVTLNQSFQDFGSQEQRYVKTAFPDPVTAHRLVKALIADGYVEKNENQSVSFETLPLETKSTSGDEYLELSQVKCLTFTFDLLKKSIQDHPEIFEAEKIREIEISLFDNRSRNEPDQRHAPGIFKTGDETLIAKATLAANGECLAPFALTIGKSNYRPLWVSAHLGFEISNPTEFELESLFPPEYAGFKLRPHLIESHNPVIFSVALHEEFEVPIIRTTFSTYRIGYRDDLRQQAGSAHFEKILGAYAYSDLSLETGMTRLVTPGYSKFSTIDYFYTDRDPFGGSDSEGPIHSHDRSCFYEAWIFQIKPFLDTHTELLKNSGIENIEITLTNQVNSKSFSKQDAQQIESQGAQLNQDNKTLEIQIAAVDILKPSFRNQYGCVYPLSEAFGKLF